MNKDIRKVRKSINRRKKMRDLPAEKNNKYTKKITPVFPQEEEKHGYFPSFLDNSSTENKHDSRVFSHFILKGILSVLLFLGVAFIWETDSAMLSNVEDWTSQALTEEFPFAKINHWYKETFGNPLSLIDNQHQTKQRANTLALPVNGNVVESFEDNGEGVLIAPEEAVNVSALQEGIVIFAGKDKHTDNTVIVQHADGSKTTYGHLESIDVHLYQLIESNQVIGHFTPTEDEQMVYFSIEKDKEYVDPVQVIKVDDNK